MNLREQLIELSIQMMLNETNKKMIENNRYNSLKNKNTSLIYLSTQDYHNTLLEADKKGYELSLQFNELLLQNDKTHNVFNDGPDAANIEAENLLYKYGLEYPISWYIKNKDHNGIHYGYEYSKTINKKHNLFLKEIIDIVTQKKLDQFTYQRLILAAEYFANLHKLLSVYHNNEVIKNTKRKTRQ